MMSLFCEASLKDEQVQWKRNDTLAGPDWSIYCIIFSCRAGSELPDSYKLAALIMAGRILP